MANSSEVRAILDLPSSSTPAPAPKKLSVPTARKPDGISRELFSLIGPSSTTLVAQLAKPRLKQKPNLGAGSKIKWQWRAFKNEYPFAKYNVQRPTFTYSEDEYTLHLEDSEWTKEETDYLMKIVAEYDTRWYVIYDRYEFAGGVARTMEDLKDRYCSVCRKLVRNRPWAGDENSKNALLSSYQFDKEREVLRKRYVASLENRTPEQIAEEEALYMEIKRLEQNERKFKRERDDLLRTIAGIDSGLPDIVEDELPASSMSSDPKRSKKRNGADLDSPSTPLMSTPLSRAARPSLPPKNSAYDLQHCITRTEPPAAATSATKAAHQPAYLRSFKLPFPKAAQAQKVTQALAELGVSHTRLVMPTQGNVALLDQLLEATTALVDTKKAVDKIEFDIQVLKNRLGMQGAAAGTAAEEGDGGTEGMEVDDGNDADGDADGEGDGDGEDGRAQSVLKTHFNVRTGPAVNVHLLRGFCGHGIDTGGDKAAKANLIQGVCCVKFMAYRVHR
ncbi:SWR1-complex protein 4 [Mycena sanguinolenta]|uniref:SWR1-complex protein 4 n=1 Tax=Mycena sanguinolenta TaxID=230812 RepID=A0A8H7D109_9AGAR|nr:SWR1-complex protein 4 [Mycena sanguinolenta]